jgi:hypothetical protein
MARLRYTDLARKKMNVFDRTSLTSDEFQTLVPAFKPAFQAQIAAWRLDGNLCTARHDTASMDCPLPTLEDRLLFILVSKKTDPLQVANSLTFGLLQGKTNYGTYVLLLVLCVPL